MLLLEFVTQTSSCILGEDLTAINKCMSPTANLLFNGQLTCKCCWIKSGSQSGLVECSHIVFAAGSVYFRATLLRVCAKKINCFKWLGGSQSKHCHCFCKYSMCLLSLAFLKVSQSSSPHLKSPSQLHRPVSAPCYLET